MRLRLNCHVTNLSASLEIFLSYQVDYYYPLDNPVSGPSFVPIAIAALHPSNNNYYIVCALLSHAYHVTSYDVML